MAGAKYACKYCGCETDDPNYSCSCYRAESVTGICKCFFVINEGPVQCVNCGQTYNSVKELTGFSCSKAPSNLRGCCHIAAR